MTLVNFYNFNKKTLLCKGNRSVTNERQENILNKISHVHSIKECSILLSLDALTYPVIYCKWKVEVIGEGTLKKVFS